MKRLISVPASRALIGLLILVPLILAACSPSKAAETPSSAVPATGGDTVQIANNPDLGQVLVTADGQTLYTNTVDTPEALKCTDNACTDFWKPYAVGGQPTAAEGFPGSLGMVIRPDGSMQVTYNDQPLYTFSEDSQPGQAKGNGFADLGGTWHVVTLGNSSGGSSSNTTSGYGGY